jgi:hypothetical protein
LTVLGIVPIAISNADAVTLGGNCPKTGVISPDGKFICLVGHGAANWFSRKPVSGGTSTTPSMRTLALSIRKQMNQSCNRLPENFSYSPIVFSKSKNFADAGPGYIFIFQTFPNLYLRLWGQEQWWHLGPLQTGNDETTFNNWDCGNGSNEIDWLK